MADDAFDAWIFAGAAERDRLRWPAVLAMWGRIGRDLAIDWVVWCATGEALRPWPHAAPTREQRAEAQALLAKHGLDYLFC